MAFFKEIWAFLRVRKKLWLLPLLLVLALFGAVVALVSSNAVAPFIYVLF